MRSSESAENAFILLSRLDILRAWYCTRRKRQIQVKAPSRCLLRPMQIGKADGKKKREKTGEPPLGLGAASRAIVYCNKVFESTSAWLVRSVEVDLGMLQVHAILIFIFLSQLQPSVCMTLELSFVFLLPLKSSTTEFQTPTPRSATVIKWEGYDGFQSHNLGR